MKRDLRLFDNTEFDVVIIGGGITGACLVHDAAQRGLKAALLEKEDFGMSTSAASSKLLHGGVRYLQKLEFGKVRESARERTYFQIIAPHLSTYVPFLIPTMARDLMKGRLALSVGMSLYRMICLGLNSKIGDPAKKAEHGVLFGKDQALALVPLLKNINGINGAHSLFESHMNNSERMTLAFIKTASNNGALVANHAEVVNILQEGRRVAGVICRDRLTGTEFTVRGRVIANAAGPFLPGLNSLIPGLNLHKNTTGFSKGVHLVTRQIEKKYALALSSSKKTEGLITRGGRHIFIIPWRNHSLIGTTNVPFTDDLDGIRVTRKDVVDFLGDINAILPGVNLDEADVKYAFVGLYPLISDEIKTDTYQGTGEYQVVDHKVHDNFDGIISVLGAKYTTARAVAEQAVDVIIEKLDLAPRKCMTATAPLFEGKIRDLLGFIAEKQVQYADLLDAGIVHNLIIAHGSDIDAVIAYCQSGKNYLEKLSPERETLVGEVAYAVEREMASALDDVVFARTGLGTIGHPGEEVLGRVADIMGELLGWTAEDRQLEIAKVNRRYQYRLQ